MAVRASQSAVILFAPGSASKARVSHSALIVFVPYTPLGIIYPLSPPAITGIGPQDFTISTVNVVGETESPFTLNQQEQQWQGQRLDIEANFPLLLTSEGEQWVAMLTALYGKFGTFLCGDYNRVTPQGAMSGAPVATGSNPSAQNVIYLDGATPSVANWAAAGDYIQLTASGAPQRLYKVLQNASSDSGGNVTLSIFPNLRETVPASTAIITSNCQGTFRLKENTFQWKIDRNRNYSISFKAKEAF